jgi:phosphotransferase system IIA component
MSHPHGIDFSGDVSKYNKSKIKFEIVRRNQVISGEGILKVDLGFISKKVRAHIECIFFDSSNAYVDSYYLNQKEFDSIHSDNQFNPSFILKII